MKQLFIEINRLRLIAVVLFCFVGTVHAQTPVAVHGQLSIVGSKLKDKNGNDYQLRGMSMFWSNWQGKFWNYETIKWLRDDWHCNVVRAAMGISPSDNTGYLSKTIAEKQKMITVIEAAIDLGIYVIVDWHSHTAQNETTEAKAFFAEIAQKYGKYPNIIYETYNEPITDWGTIKTYHTAVVGEIRKYDTKNIVILGTPFYSQNIDEATNSPLAGSNLSYALHYYAASHSFWGSVGTVLTKGYSVFVSEFGTCDASGAGSVDVANSNKWWDELDKVNVSWCNWAVSDVNEAAAIVKSGSSITGGWNPSVDLTVSGILVRNKLRGYAQDALPTGIAPYITASPQSLSVPFQAAASFKVEVAGAGPFTYKWFFKGAELPNTNAASLSIPSVTPADTGSYSCSITNAIGTTMSKTACLDVRYRSSYYAKSQTIPGIIQLEDYDKGGQDIGYYDACVGNSGGAYRPTEDVDIEAISGQTGEYAVNFTEAGEWMSYSVNVGWDAAYTIDLFYAALTDGGAFSIDLDNTPVVAKTTLSSTGGWSTYNKKTVTVNLTKGEHILKFRINTPGSNLDYLEFKSTIAPNIAPVITAQPKNTAVRAGKPVNLYVSATGATPMTYQWYYNGTEIAGATSSSYSIAVSKAADAGDYSVIVTNKLGVDTSAIASVTIINTAAYQGVPAVIPGRVFCKNFDEGGEGVAYHDLTTENEGVTKGTAADAYRPEGVDTQASTDGGSGFSIGYISALEWMDYSVMVKYSGTYTVGFRVASASTAGTAALALLVDGVKVVDALSVPNTGGWTTWKTIEKKVTLTAGGHVIRFFANVGEFNINYIDFTADLCELSVPLNQGWNLFALPLIPSNAAVASVFAGISDLQVKNNTQFYRAGQAAELNSLTTLEQAKGYLVYNGGTATSIKIVGKPADTNPAFNLLSSGWNLVGISSDAVTANSLGTSVTVVKNFEGFFMPGNTKSTIKTLNPGEGYFIKIQ